MSVRLLNGVWMPEVGLGTYLASGQPLTASVRAALDGGIQHIDTASMYRVCAGPAQCCATAI